jgi:hypothetical protein
VIKVWVAALPKCTSLYRGREGKELFAINIGSL